MCTCTCILIDSITLLKGLNTKVVLWNVSLSLMGLFNLSYTFTHNASLDWITLIKLKKIIRKRITFVFASTQYLEFESTLLLISVILFSLILEQRSTFCNSVCIFFSTWVDRQVKSVWKFVFLQNVDSNVITFIWETDLCNI